MIVWMKYVVFATIFRSFVSSYKDPWIWFCNPKLFLCQRILKSNITQEKDLFTSIELCRLTCGKYGSLWPKPTIATKLGRHLVQIHPRNIKFSNPVLPQNTDMLLKDIQKVFLRKPSLKCTKCEYTENAVKIHLDFLNTQTELVPKIDEHYTLIVKTQFPQVYVNISAANVFGVRHGLETLSQLIAINRTANKNGNITLWMVSKVSISDKPKYTHRGLLVDTSRHYLKLGTIKKQIDALGMSKMNVLHWHATDSHSFPIFLPSVPELAQYGAYSPDKIYTLKDIEDVIRYAKIRGVRVILEIDTPSHAGNGWQFGSLNGLGELGVCINYSPYQNYCIQPPCGQLNPANQNVYKILENTFKDIGQVYSKSEYFHVGGDEISLPCWNATEEIVTYMKKSNITTDKTGYLKLWTNYQSKILDAYDKFVKNGNRKVIVWSNALTNLKTAGKYLDKDRYVIQSWVPHGSPLPKMLVRKGYEIIISSKNTWYLDHGIKPHTKYSNWRRVFAQRMPRHKSVLGGEVCMWGEYADDSNIDAKIWPRAAAAAERLWVNSWKDRTKHVEQRFYQHRERLVANKVNAEPAAPEWCVYNEGLC